MSYFTVAIVSLLLAELLWASGLGNPLQHLGNPWVLAGVHLTTIGFLTVIIMGALHQFVPVLTKTELASQGWSGVSLGSIVVGLAGMVLGFLALPGGVIAENTWLLPAGGALVVAGAVIAAINLGVTLKRAWPWQLPAWLVASGLFYLVVTVLAGLVLALSLTVPQLFTQSQLMVIGNRGLESHIVGGVIGWLTLTVMGVSYKLLAMFTLSDEHRGLLGWIAYIAAAVGITETWVCRWAGLNIPANIGWFVTLAGLSMYLLDMRRLYQQRKRRHLELNARYGVIPLMILAVLIVGSLNVLFDSSRSRLDVALVFLALYGWLGGMALTQLYKIIPFLAWINRFGSRMGKQKTPRVQDLVNELRDHYAYIVYFIAIILATGFLLTGWFPGFRLAMAAAFLATIDIARALYRAAHSPATALGAQPEQKTKSQDRAPWRIPTH
jgi:hypothetical protein